MVKITGREALNMVLATELDREDKVICIGENLREGGATGAHVGLYQRYGGERIIETPVSENGIFGAALGLALGGYQPVVEIFAADFALTVANEIMSDIPKWRQQQARPGPLYITMRGWMGSTLGLGPEHSQCMESYFHHAPGLDIICPGTPRDMAGLLRAAIRSPNPCLFLEHRRIYDQIDDVPDSPDFVGEIGVAETVRQGTDATVVAWSWMRHVSVKAATVLEREGISLEIIDPRTIKPMDFASIADSVERTGRLVVVEEAPLTGSIGAEIVARISEQTNRPISVTRIAMPDAIHPYSAEMEKSIIPDAESVAARIRSFMQGEKPIPAPEQFTF